MNVRGRNSLVRREKDRAREKAGTGENPDQEIALSPDDGNVSSYRGGAAGKMKCTDRLSAAEAIVVSAPSSAAAEKDDDPQAVIAETASAAASASAVVAAAIAAASAAAAQDENQEDQVASISACISAFTSTSAVCSRNIAHSCFLQQF